MFVSIALLHLIGCSAAKADDSASKDSAEDLADKFVEMVKNLNAEKKKLKSDKEKLKKAKAETQAAISKIDVIRLNVGGEVVVTTRASLDHVPTSTFALLLNGRWEDRLSSDLDGNNFLDFNPKLFLHLLEQLRRVKKGDTPNLVPPHPASSNVHRSFDRMLERLHLKPSSGANNPVIVMDVGGQAMLTRQKKLDQLKLVDLLSRSAVKNVGSRVKDSTVFVDADPQLFQHVMKQISNDDSTTQNTSFQTPSNKQSSAFNRLLQMLGLSGE